MNSALQYCVPVLNASNKTKRGPLQPTPGEYSWKRWDNV